MLHQAANHFGSQESLRSGESAAQAELRQLENIRDLFDQLSRFQQFEDFADSCLDFAELLIEKQQPRAAYHGCLKALQHAHQVQLQRQDDADEKAGGGGQSAALPPVDKATTLRRLEQQVRTLMSTAVSRCMMVIQIDPDLESASSVVHVTNRLEDVTKAMSAAFARDEALVHQIFNGTVHIMRFVIHLIQRQYHRQAAVFVAWCARTMDSVIALSATRYLHWRVRIYETLALCYEGIEDYKGALAVANYLASRVDDLHALEHLDLVAPPPDTVAKLEHATQRAKTCVAKYTFLSSAKPSAATSAQNEEAVAAATTGKKGATGSTETTSGAPGIPPTPSAVLEAIVATFPAPGGTAVFPRLVWSALSMRTALPGDRRVAPPTDLLFDPASGTARAQLNKAATDALAMILERPMDEFMRRHGGGAS
mgnify:FL=1